MAAKKIEYVGRRQNLWGRWQIETEEATHYIPVRHHTEPREQDKNEVSKGRTKQ